MEAYKLAEDLIQATVDYLSSSGTKYASLESIFEKKIQEAKTTWEDEAADIALSGDDI